MSNKVNGSSLRKNFITASRIIKIFIVVLFTLIPQSTPAQSCSEPNFHAASNFNSGLTEPRSLAIADFNHDGNPDVVLGGFGPLFSESRYTAVLFGNEGGSFSKPLIIPYNTFGVATGDFNGDGHPDIVLDGLKFFYGDGAGNFAGPDELLVPGDTGRVYAADFNNDGRSDVLYFNSAISPFSNVFLSNSSGGFTQIAGPSIFKPQELSFGDFNGDSKTDFVSDFGSGIQVSLGDGAGHFQPQPPIQIVGFVGGGGVPQASDFNHDGKLDVVVNKDFNFRLFFPGDGTGGFGPAATQQTAFAVRITADFNRDGHLDIAGSEQNNVAFRIGLGDGTGAFTESAPHAIGGLSTQMLSPDFNKDGKADIVSVNPGSDDVSVVFGDGAGGFEAADVFRIGNRVLSAVGAGDFNGDGKADLALAQSGDDRLTFLQGDGGGSFPTSFTHRTLLTNLTYLATGEFNHDGKTDLVGISPNDNKIVVVFGGLLDSSNREISFLQPISANTGDFNNDTHLDIVLINSSSYGILLGNGAGDFGPLQTVSLSTKPSSVSVGDFTGDSKLDLAIANEQPNSVSILIGSGSGTFTAGATLDLNPGSTQPRATAVADFNSDSKLDLAVANRDQNAVLLFLGNGNGSFAAPVSYEALFGPIRIIASDLNLDGRPDLLAMNDRFSSNISMLMNDGNGGFLKQLNYGVGDRPIGFGLADFNSDARPDIAVANSTSNNVVLLLSAPCRPPDLAARMSHEGNFAVGMPGVYKVTVTNTSLSRAVGPTTITDSLPQGLTFVSGVGNGWQCSAAGQQVTCNRSAPLDAGEVTEVTLTVTASVNATPGVTNIVTVSHLLDINSSNNTSADDTIVNTGAGISGRILDETGNPLVGVSVVLQGIVKQTVATAANGFYSFSGLPEGLTYTVTPTMPARFFLPAKKVFRNLRVSGSGDFVGKSQTNGKIVFSRNVGGHINIWTMNADGSAAVQLTSASEFDTKPQWSPDGSKIAFQRGSDQSAAIFVMNADGSNQHRVSPGEGNSPAWSPDGQKLAYTKQLSAFPGVYTIDVNGNNEQRVFVPFGGFLKPLSWSPDGSAIAFTRQPPTLNFSFSDFHLYTMDSNGFFQKLLIDNGNTTELEPDYSPDGLKLVYLIHDLNLRFDMAIANSDGTGQVVLGQVSGVANPSWSPDGTKLLFIDGDDIWTSNTDGAGRINLTQSADIEGDPDWQPLRAANGPNQIDDAAFFVRQHYQDFLNRTPDAPGLAFWTNEITSCGANTQCTEIKRINVSAAFFLSIEFQQTGYLVERTYKTAYGDADGVSTIGGLHHLSVPVVRLSEFLPDTQQIGEGVVVNTPGWEDVLRMNKELFFSQFVERPRFKNAYPTSMSAVNFVGALDDNAGHPLSSAERNQLIADLTAGTKTRAQVLQAIAEDTDLVTAESNRAFVLMQYFGYLRRNPNDPPDSDYSGFDFWLRKLNDFNGNFINAEMVKAFLSSIEYRQRFGH